ncbi:MAG: SAM-dependent methyltransferase, partial [Fusobacterium sp.]
RDLKLEDIDNLKTDYIVMDVSFISITNVFEHLKIFFSSETKLMALIKPQFEVEKSMLSKGGIVREKEYQIFAIERVIEEAEKNGLYLESLDYSPIKGCKGNSEYISIFGVLKKEVNINIGEIVNSCENLGGAL